MPERTEDKISVNWTEEQIYRAIKAIDFIDKQRRLGGGPVG